MDKSKKNLSIRYKVIISMLILGVAFIAIFYLISTKVILKSYIAFENDVVNTNIKRVDFAIKNMEHNQAVKLRDWAVWDSTYNFLKDHNKDYLEENLQIVGMKNMDVSFIAFVDIEGKIVFSKIIDIQKGEELDAGLLNTALLTQDKILTHSMPNDLVSGVIQTPFGIAFVSSTPVLRSDGSGPSTGSIIFGNFLDNDIAKKIGDGILYPVSIFGYNDPDLPDDITLVKSKLSNANKNFIQVLSSNEVAGYSLIYDLDNKIVAISKITSPRDFYNKGQDSFNFFLMIIGLILVLLIFEIMVIFELLVIRKFVKLNKEVSEIGDLNDLTKRIKVDKNDEIGNLSTIINNMLDRLSLAQQKEKGLIESEKIAVENLKKHTEEVEKLNSLMMNRELKMIELKKEIEDLKNKQNN